jgi:RNA polymerase sigma-70 factor (ECF subfamily)
VQDAFLGLTRARQAGTEIADPKAYLATAVTRLGINYLGSARVRRETYVGDWLPEPIVVPAGAPGPAEHAELADSLSMAFLVLLEALSPLERAVFMLREVFGYGLLYDADGRVVSVLELDVAGGMVQAMHAVVNPDKLGHLGPVSDEARRPERRTRPGGQAASGLC